MKYPERQSYRSRKQINQIDEVGIWEEMDVKEYGVSFKVMKTF